MPELLYEQEGGEMKPSSKDSGGGSRIGANTIDMKIQLVRDASLPSYLIPDLTCDDGLTIIPASKVNVTLTGDSLHKETSDPQDFKCEITSNFLTDKEKSAITIETYYVDSNDDKLLGINKIYFDESLLSYYDKSNVLKKSDNPFSKTSTTTDSGVTYTFDFDFNDIINDIAALPSYKQIQNMFMLVNNIDSKQIQSTITQTALIKIFDDAFLNLKFSGVPFSSTRTDTSTLTLNIATTNDPIPESCALKNLFGIDILTKNLHKVLELLDYKDFDFIAMTKAPVPQPFVNPAAAKAAKAAADLATAEAEHKVATAAAAAAEVEAEKAKTDAKPVIDKAVGEIKTKMGLMIPDDKAKIPPAVKTFIDASQALATAKAGTDADAIAREEAAFKAAYIDPNLKKAIDAGLATGSSLPSSVQAVLTEAKTIQDEHAKMDTADAEVVKTKAVMDATREKAAKAWDADQAAKAWDADQAATNAATKLNTRTGTEAAAGSAIKVVNTNNTQAASTTSTELENKLKEIIATQSEKLNYVIARLEALQLSQTNTGSSSVAGFGNVIVRAPGDSDACGNGGISMESRDGSLIFKVPYDKIISEIAPNMRSAMARKVLENKAAGPNAANSDAVTGNATKPEQQQRQQQQQPDGVAATLDADDKTALQTAKDGLAAQQSRLTTAGITKMPQAITDLETAIQTAETAVATFDALTSTDASKATALNDAKTKFGLLTGLVIAAASAAQTAIDTAPKPPVDENAAKIQTLNGRLSTAKQKLQDAKGKLTGINHKPNSDAADDAVAAADTAIKSATSAADKKAEAVDSATQLVTTAEAAVKSFSEAVEADVANASKPAEEGVPSFTDYETAWTSYDTAKKAFDEAYKKANETPGQAGGAKATAEQIAAAKEKLKTDVESVVKGISDDTKGITKISADDFNKQLTEAIAKQAAITKLTDATKVYTESLAKIKQFQATYDAAVADKDDNASKNPEADKIGDALGKIGIAIEKVEEASGLLDTAIGASQAADAAKAKTTSGEAADAAPAAADDAAKETADAAAAPAAPAAPTAEAAAAEAAISVYNTAKDAAKALATKAAGEAAEAAKAVTDAAEAAAAVTQAARAVTDAAAAVQSDVSSYNTESTDKLTSQKALFERLSAALQQLKKPLEALKQKLEQKPGNETPGSGEDESANDAAAAAGQKAQKEAATMQTYRDFYNTFKQCLVVGEGNDASQGETGKVRKKVVSDSFVTILNNCFKDNKYNNTNVLPFFEAVQAASLNSKAYNIDSEKFNGKDYKPEIEGNNINHDLLLVIINSLEPNATIFTNTRDGIDKTSFEELIKSLTGMLSSEQNTLMTEIKQKFKEDEESSSFSLFDGGSNKPKSTTKSKSSSSKSSSKSKSKNKTKKNHSKSKSNKSKTPKIIMNE